jgi:hypothetical protein
MPRSYPIATITEKGEKMLDESLKLFQALDERCYAGFTQAELDQLHAFQTGHFHKFQAYEVELELKAGENTISVFGYAKSEGKGDTEWMPNFDYIIIPEVTKNIEVSIAAISIE